MEENFTLKEFGDLKVGDKIQGGSSDGSKVNSVEVTAVYEKHIPETMFEVEDEDGNIVEVSGNHLWYVETEFDRSLHASRKKDLKTLFGKLDKKIINKLEAIAKGKEDLETSLIDMIALLEYDSSFSDSENVKDISKKEDIVIQKKTNALTRIAESIGHIAENSAIYEDSYTGEELSYVSVRTYDAGRFAQQILAGTGIRKFSNEWKLNVGKIITTEKMFELSGGIDNFVECAQVDMYIPDSQ